MVVREPVLVLGGMLVLIVVVAEVVLVAAALNMVFEARSWDAALTK